jgi:hypothetical protein
MGGSRLPTTVPETLQDGGWSAAVGLHPRQGARYGALLSILGADPPAGIASGPVRRFRRGEADGACHGGARVLTRMLTVPPGLLPTVLERPHETGTDEGMDAMVAQKPA